MSEGPRRQPNEVGRWDAEAIADNLARPESAGQIFILKGVTASHVHRDAPQLRGALDKHGLPLFILDPTGAAGTGTKFLDILNDYVRVADQRGRLSDDARHLFEFVSSASDQTQSGHFPAAGGNLYADTLCRLWTSLSKGLPAVLLVLNAQHCPPSELKALDHLSSFFFADPIEQLTPELDAIEKGQGRLVYLEGADAIPVDLEHVPTTTIDLSEAAEESVREFLADPAVVRRFIESTGGDPRRLGELVESLPEDVENFWLFRYDRLERLERTLINVLAVAAEPILVDTLHSALSLLQASEFFARSLRHLTELGFVERKIGAGTVRVHIESPEFARAVIDTLEQDTRREIHQALADAELANDNSEASAAFLARHCLAAGNVAAGLKYGKRAAKRLISRRDYDQAQDLLESLLEFSERDEDSREIHAQLIEVHSALGNHRKALAHCSKLQKLVDDEQALARLNCQTGQLLIRIGEYDSATDRFVKAADLTAQNPELREIWIEAKLGEGEAMFSQGRHQAAEERALEVLEQIEEARQLDTRDRHHLDMSLLHARNLIGKVTVLRGECQKGRELFVKNRTLAAEWGWDDEVARAEANLGLVCLQEKDFSEALDRLERAREIARSPAAIPRAYVFLNLGIVHQRKGRYEEALRHYLEGLRASRQEGAEASYGLAAYNLVTLYQDIGAFERALSIIDHLEERQEGDETTHFVGTLPTAVLGSILLDQRKYEEALEVFARLTDADDESTASSLPVREALLRSVEAHLALGQKKAAERIVEEFELPEKEARQPQLDALYELARILIAIEDGDYEPALTSGREAAERAHGAGHTRDALRLSFAVARALRENDRPEEARALLERELQELKGRAADIPVAHRGDFFSVPLHQDLVTVVRELKGEVPEEFDIEHDDAPEEDAKSNTVDAQDPAFKRWRSRYGDIVGEDPRLHQLFRIIDRVAESDSPVLLQGESGTGKELMAEAVHTHSKRTSGPFVKVNCAAFVEDLLLSELFGHVKGAFTGAVSEKVGRFELADGGTIFLDEIGDISAKTQVALLRVLQEGTFEKVGGTETQQVDVRVVCATNKNLEEMVKRGEFRLDLYYRLKGVVMEVPALRQRRQDIPRLVAHFARVYAGGRQPKQFSKDVLKFLASYSWPGNIRELQNFVKSILLFVEGETVEMSHVQEFSEFFADGEVDFELPEIDYEVELEEYEEVGETYEDPEEALVEQIIAEGLSLASIKKRLELESIRRALIETGGNITRAAEILQMKRPRLSQIVNSTDELLALKKELVG
ncbi:tetratricopeptide repeat protein [Persicimonas caeni]|uniref:Tetratricopeptide repeat protein n=1 Tax=Persicimonas caeni TaxID=2292766 RepID=A0A4Y6Q2M5_PERCE|nr:sigma 54-interacting transcriptional regulator [Persicimonas caeni]QDG54700.1 tetratricopeptide repeat protein [Persicimonas caeni]QED35921.1 tetratricopeptide repeat protein [Persicimonas caeni]